MRRELLLVVGSVVGSAAVLLALLRWLAPGLLGLPVDLRLVGRSEEVPPFYEGVFRREDYETVDTLVPDPVTVTRARPRLPDMGTQGPHDILGFRNRAVPNVADVVAVGDSQTYGLNAPLEETWPARLTRRLPGERIVYSMATGGWGAMQYVEMATRVTVFQPQVLVVAFYAGNDSLESFRLAYGSDEWADFRVDPTLGPGDAPRIPFPAPPDAVWEARLPGGARIAFTPELRLVANRGAAAQAGYAIMERAGREIARLVRPHGVRIVFTVIPTKERVYAQRIDRREAPAAYRELVDAETRRTEALAAGLSRIEGAAYVDLVAPLRAAAARLPLYPRGADGHPTSAGYDTIARALAPVVAARLLPRPRGLFGLPVGGGEAHLVLVSDEGVWRFPSRRLARENGWPLDDGLPIVSGRYLAGQRWRGLVREVDPERFGPAALEPD